MLKYKPTKHKPVLKYGACTPRDIVIRTTKIYNNNKNSDNLSGKMFTTLFEVS